MWGRRRHGLTNHFTLAVYMQFLVTADSQRVVYLLYADKYIRLARGCHSGKTT